MSRTLWKRSREITILHRALSWSTAIKSIKLQLFYFHFHPLPLTCFLFVHFKLTCSSLALRWHSKLATATHRRPHASWLWPACGYIIYPNFFCSLEFLISLIPPFFGIYKASWSRSVYRFWSPCARFSSDHVTSPLNAFSTAENVFEVRIET